MSNRTDFGTLSRELADMFFWNDDVIYRVHKELHNAYVAGREARSLPDHWPKQTNRYGEGRGQCRHGVALTHGCNRCRELLSWVAVGETPNHEAPEHPHIVGEP